jgi:hypothetical protein
MAGVVCVDDVKQKVGLNCFFESGSKGRDQRMWKVAYKSDRIR